ncbi:LIM domain-binding protein [Aspergillus lucknowensis]|uniref:LIM-domain binding protein-domain-containing protein n=1 Tax=Aspergillus lucknowensis TaxID=176173 RepID=A0ABR4M844_9EURO
MAPGQHPTAHPGTMVQQVHPGVSAPGGPQVTQGGPMMGAMPPGAGTTGPGPVQAHALSHLGPQAHLFQQQQYAQNFAGNPHLMQQHHQNMLRQRMMYQQAQAQQPQPQPQQQGQQQQPHPQPQQHQGLPVSLPNGTQALNTAHMVAMQNPAMRAANLQMQQLQQMPHAQPQNIQQQQQFLAMQQAAQAQAQAQAQVQQAQAQQAQQAQQQNANAQPGQHTPQPRSAPQPQNVHDAQSVTPQPQPGPPQHQGSATPQPNPPPQAPSSQPPPPQQQPVVTQPQPTPNLAPQQLPQAQPSGQQPQPQQPQTQPQAQQQPQQQQQQPQQGPGQQQGQQPHPMTAQEAQLKAQQQQQQNAAMLMQQQRIAARGQSIISLGNFAEQLSSFVSRGEANDLLYWQTFVDKFYSPTGVLRQGVYNPQAGSKQFEIATPALARYYNTQFTSGIRQIQMLIEGPRERESPNGGGGHIVECPRASFIYWFTNDAQLFATGTLRAHFDFQNKIEMLDIVVMNHTEYLPRSQLQALEMAEQKQSPKVSKNMGKRAQQKQPQQPAFTLPESMVTSNGVPTPVMSFLEVAETISQMQLLFQYSHQHPNLTPSESLRSLVGNIHSQNQNPMLMQGAMNPALQQGPNARAPSIGGPNQFASPAMAHLALPGGVQGSPHLTGSAHPSPAQSNLPGPPGMGPQGQIPQGVAQVGSASASPNVSNKRRRASTVKMEGEDGGPEVNGTAAPGPAKVKASPRVGGKRQKGTAT